MQKQRAGTELSELRLPVWEIVRKCTVNAASWICWPGFRRSQLFHTEPTQRTGKPSSPLSRGYWRRRRQDCTSVCMCLWAAALLTDNGYQRTGDTNQPLVFLVWSWNLYMLNPNSSTFVSTVCVSVADVRRGNGSRWSDLKKPVTSCAVGKTASTCLARTLPAWANTCRQRASPASAPSQRAHRPLVSLGSRLLRFALTNDALPTFSQLFAETSKVWFLEVSIKVGQHSHQVWHLARFELSCLWSDPGIFEL